MRAFVFLLILANLSFFAWSRGMLGSTQSPDALRVQQQLLPEQVNVVARDEPPGAVKPEAPPAAVEEKKASEACLQVNDLPLAEIVRIESLMAAKFSAFKTERTMNPGSGHYWVFIPPLPSKQDADRKAGELKKLQVPEFFVVQDAGPSRFAISLGIFSSKDAAAERLAELREKGVRSAKMGERDLKPPTGTLGFQGPEPQVEPLQLALKENLPNGKLVACKAKVSAAQ